MYVRFDDGRQTADTTGAYHSDGRQIEQYRR